MPKYLQRIWDTFMKMQSTFRDMVITKLLKFGYVCPFPLRDMGYFSKYLMGYLGPPSRASKLYQGSHRLEKYLNIQKCLEKSLKIKFALKST